MMFESTDEVFVSRDSDVFRAVDAGNSQTNISFLFGKNVCNEWKDILFGKADRHHGARTMVCRSRQLGGDHASPICNLPCALLRDIVSSISGSDFSGGMSSNCGGFDVHFVQEIDQSDLDDCAQC